MNKFIYSLFLALALAFSINTEAQVESGDAAMAAFDYERALQHYQYAFDNRVQTPYLLRKIGYIYFMLGDLSESKKWYEKVVHLDSSYPLDLLYLAECYKFDNSYEEAMRYYKKFNAAVPSDRRGISHTRDDSLFIKLKQDSALYKINKLKMNTDKPEFGLTPYKGKTFLFSAAGIANPEYSHRKNKEVDNPYLDVFKVTTVGEYELEIVDFIGGWINSEYHDGPVVYCPEYNEIFVTRNNVEDDEPVRDSQGRINLRILSSIELGGEWSSPVVLPFNDKEYSCAHPSISADGNTLYFASNMAGSFGGTDIYVSKRENATWSEPVNVGPSINTEGNEAFPYVTKDGDLYFASDGHAGLGGYDMFISNNVGGKWTTPVNLKAPINTNKDDISLLPIKGGREGYLSSNRDSQMNDDDIFHFKKIADFIAKIHVKDQYTGKAIDGVDIVIKDMETGDIIFDGPSDENGEVSVMLMENKDYHITFKKPGWFLKEQDMTTKERESGIINVYEYMEEMEIGGTYVINNVFFDYNKSNIRPDAALELLKIVKMMSDNPTLKIELSSHSDCRGGKEYNLKLSDRRAKSSAAYIVSQGVIDARIEGKGYGEAKLVNECECEGKKIVPCTEEQHQENRRTEFTVIDF